MRNHESLARVQHCPLKHNLFSTCDSLSQKWQLGQNCLTRCLSHTRHKTDSIDGKYPVINEEIISDFFILS